MKKLTLILALIAIAGLFFMFDIQQYLTLESLKQNHLILQSYVNESPFQAILIYVGSYIIFTAINLPGAVFFTLAGGALFGLVLGTVLVSFAASVGSTGAFLIARYLLKERLQKRVGNKMAAINKGIETEGAYYLFTLRLVPLFPFFLINIAMALTPIKVWTFYWVSQIGMLAGTVVYVNAGTQLASLENISDILSIRIIVLFALLGVFPLLAKKLSELASKKLLATHK